jgi:hypothetical protein
MKSSSCESSRCEISVGGPTGGQKEQGAETPGVVQHRVEDQLAVRRFGLI